MSARNGVRALPHCRLSPILLPVTLLVVRVEEVEERRLRRIESDFLALADKPFAFLRVVVRTARLGAGGPGLDLGVGFLRPVRVEPLQDFFVTCTRREK